ncbi:MAG: hypothetical protein IH858_08430 [Chloroflexi bacterium]|nr:hypothetical protein [Chloroflexota bacterium]
MGEFERTDWGDVYFAVLGRALAIATRFEASARSLTSLLGLGENPNLLASKNELVRFLTQLRKSSLYAQIEAFGITDPELSRSLDAAREARNEIAHELAIGFDRTVENIPEEYLVDTVERARDLTRAIAEADALLCFILSSVTSEPLPSRDYLGRYPELVASWVGEIGRNGG